MTRKRSDSIADDLEDMILEARIKDGDRLDETQLARRYAVSRTPIREALQRLAQSGLVEHLPRRGVFVRQPGAVQLLEMFEVMAELEAACARLAAQRLTDDAPGTLDAIHARSTLAAEAGDAELYYAENERFHQTIYRLSGNGFLEAEALRLQRRLKPFRRMQLRLRGRLRQSLDEHAAIIAALGAADGARAAEQMRAHVAVQGDKFHHLVASLKIAAE